MTTDVFDDYFVLKLENMVKMIEVDEYFFWEIRTFFGVFEYVIFLLSFFPTCLSMIN